MHTIPYVNDGSSNQPSLKHHLNLFSIAGTPALFDTPKMKLKGMSLNDYECIKSDGFEGVQSHIMLTPSTIKCGQAGLKRSAAGIVNPNQLASKVKHWKSNGYLCATIMMGSGKETKREALNIAELVIRTSQEHDFPIYLELHRGTVTQDITTVLSMIRAYPGLKFNGDFSHYIVSYRWLETFSATTLKKISPILERIAYLHLRPANSQHIQVAEWTNKELKIYRTLLLSTFCYFLSRSKPGDCLIAAPELLPTITGYNDLLKSPKGHIDIADRYQQCLDLKHLSQQWFQQIEHQRGQAISYSGHELPQQSEPLVNPIVEIQSTQDWNQLKNPKYKFANHIRIALAHQLQTQEEISNLISSYLQQQQKDRRICLETRRNTVCHTLDSTLRLQQQFPDIRLCLNISEWMLGEEITVEQLPSMARRLKPLRNIIAIKKAYATAEHRYYGPIKYQPSTWRSLSVITERLYTRFYHKVWDKISAHIIIDHDNTKDIAHQAILYARQQYQKA